MPKQTVDKDGVYNMVDKSPEFDGNLMEYLGKNIQYPEKAKKDKKEGRVVIKFVIDEGGNVTKAQVLKSPDPELSDAAIKVVNSMPKWTPGENKGKKVKVHFTLPIMYKLDSPEPTEFQKTLQKTGYNTNGKLKLFPDDDPRTNNLIIVANGC